MAARASSEPLYVSRNHLEGSLIDASLDRVLAACRKHLVTGVVRVHTRGRDGVLELRAGVVDTAHAGELTGNAALDALRAIRDGWYEVAQRLPDLSGDLAGAASIEGDIDGVPVIALMRHCEEHALTVTITVISGFDRACIDYRAGEIARVELNGFIDDDVLPQIVGWPDARFRVAAPPLDLDIEGWPVTRRAATAPLMIGKDHHRNKIIDALLADDAEVKVTPFAMAEPTRVPRPPAITASGSVVVRAPTAPPVASPSIGVLLEEVAEPPRRMPRAITWNPAGDLRQETRSTRRAPRRAHRAVTPAGYDWGSTGDVLWLVLATSLLIALGVTSLLLLT